MSAASLRARYLGDAVATSSPQQVLVMLYDRLALDLERAQKAVAAGDAGRGQRAAAARAGDRPRAAVQPAGRRLGGRAPAGRALQLADQRARAGQRQARHQPHLGLPPGGRAAPRRVAAGRRLAGRQPVMTGGRRPPPSDAGAGPAPPVNWAVVLDHLEGEVLAAEETMAARPRRRDRRLGTARRRLGAAVEPRPAARRPARARRPTAAAPARRRRGPDRADHPVPAAARRRRADVLRARRARSPPSSTAPSDTGPLPRLAPAPAPPLGPADGGAFVRSRGGIRAFRAAMRPRKLPTPAAPSGPGHGEVTAGHIGHRAPRPATGAPPVAGRRSAPDGPGADEGRARTAPLRHGSADPALARECLPRTRRSIVSCCSRRRPVP